MARIKKTPSTRTRRDFVVRSLTLTPAADTTLHQISQDASDSLGWTVGSSAVVRALLQYAAQKGTSWAQISLFPQIEREIQGGLFWGSRKK